jgi:uncharacterized membrane protein YdbT with pleckstrin-like domain
MKFIRAGYLLTLLVIVALLVLYFKYWPPEHRQPWLPGVPALLLLWPIKRHLQRQAVKLTISGDKLRFETGMAAKSTRIIQLPKVQDVRVFQTVAQRMFGVGDLAIETAGENSRLMVENLDQPRQLAEQITDLSGHAPPLGSP